MYFIIIFYQLSWRLHISSLDVSTVSVFDLIFSFFIRINCLTVFSSLKFTDVSQLVVSVRDCLRLRFLIIERIRWKLLSSLDSSPTSCKLYRPYISVKYSSKINEVHR